MPRAAAALRGQLLRDPLRQSRRRLAFPEVPTVLLLVMLFSWAHDSDTGRAATFISKNYLYNQSYCALAPSKPHVRTSNLSARKALRFKTRRSKNLTPLARSQPESTLAAPSLPSELFSELKTCGAVPTVPSTPAKAIFRARATLPGPFSLSLGPAA